jgi:4-hydroxybutyryl-CoA dehydratase / vinylacetyl-CoA-Delta-isomerase
MIGAEEYLASLRDGRAVWLEGRRVDDVTAHPVLRKSVDWVASTYDRFAGEENPVYRVPRDRDELQQQIELLLSADRTVATTAGCMALRTVADALAEADPAYAERLRAFTESCRTRDARVAAAVDDTAQPVRIESRRSDGIVISGGKQHVVGGPVVHELLVVPERGVDDAHADRAVAVAVPVASPGVRLVASTAAPRAEDDRSYPVSRERAVTEALVVFDSVFVPWERVFLAGEPSLSGSLASTLSIWERARAVAEQADRAELIMGLAQTISDMNGITGVSHVRDKLSAIAVWAKMCRAGWEAALASASVNAGGMVCPDESYLYATKSYGGHLYSEMTHRLHDVAGGLVITAPAIADLDNENTGDYVRKYMRTMDGVSGEDRLRIFHVIRDLTADTYGGWDKVTNQVVGGGMHHQRMAALDAFDLATVTRRARAAAGIN